MVAGTTKPGRSTMRVRTVAALAALVVVAASGVPSALAGTTDPEAAAMTTTSEADQDEPTEPGVAEPQVTEVAQVVEESEVAEDVAVVEPPPVVEDTAEGPGSDEPVADEGLVAEPDPTLVADDPSTPGPDAGPPPLGAAVEAGPGASEAIDPCVVTHLGGRPGGHLHRPPGRGLRRRPDHGDRGPGHRPQPPDRPRRGCRRS